MKDEAQQLKQMAPQDEMNLIEFLQTLWKQKFLILLTTVICLSAGVAYIFFSPSTYEAMGYIRPPSLGDIAYINQGRLSDNKELFTSLQPKEVYEVFANVLKSESLKQSFFKTVFLPSMQNKDKSYSEAKLYADFSNSLAVNAIMEMPISKDSSLADYSVSFKGSSPQEDAEFVKKYIAQAREKAVNEFINEMNRQRRQLVHELREKINTIRTVTNSQRLDRIEQIQEAIKIAQVVEDKKSTSSLVKTDALISNEPTMMYLRGTVALRAELANLSNRSSSDAFTAKTLKFRETEGLYDFYRNINYSQDKVIMFRFDNEVRVSERSVAAHKKKILLLSLFLGLFFGSVLAVLQKPLSLILR